MRPVFVGTASADNDDDASRLLNGVMVRWAQKEVCFGFAMLFFVWVSLVHPC